MSYEITIRTASSEEKITGIDDADKYIQSLPPLPGDEPFTVSMMVRP